MIFLKKIFIEAFIGEVCNTFVVEDIYKPNFLEIGKNSFVND